MGKKRLGFGSQLAADQGDSRPPPGVGWPSVLREKNVALFPGIPVGKSPPKDLTHKNNRGSDYNSYKKENGTLRHGKKQRKP